MSNDKNEPHEETVKENMHTANTVIELTKNSPDGVNLHRCVSGGSTLQTCESEHDA